VLGKLARQHDPNVLVGFDHADDAGVYQLTPETALVQTVDFFTPIVDDPYTFGQIAATNSLSDVYAMGGKPLTSLALVCFPDKADLGILERILAGGLSKMVEAGCTVIGGHSIRDEETKFGYSVTGVVNPKRVLANQGSIAGDRLLFTKALGTGVISTAIKKGEAKQRWIDAAVKSMTTLNKVAAEIIVTGPDKPITANNERRATNNGFAVHALTDITGFGLIGHAREMALASNVSMVLYAERVPILEGALDSIRAGHIPGGLKANREFAGCVVEFGSAVSEDVRTLLFDPQTAGGLLISVAAENASGLLSALIGEGVPAVEIGEVIPSRKPLIDVH
jgi:selenide, water dikinase